MSRCWSRNIPAAAEHDASHERLGKGTRTVTHDVAFGVVVNVDDLFKVDSYVEVNVEVNICLGHAKFNNSANVNNNVNVNNTGSGQRAESPSGYDDGIHVRQVLDTKRENVFQAGIHQGCRYCYVSWVRRKASRC